MPLFRSCRTCLLAAVVMAAFLSAASVSAGGEIAAPDTLQYNLDTHGTVRVIAKLDVDGYAQLRAASTAQQLALPNAHIDTAAVRQADQALASAIAAVAGTVQDRLIEESATLEHVFSYLPLAVFTVDAAGLANLAAQPEVLQIVEDTATPLPERPETDTDQPMLSDGTHIIGADTLWERGITGKGMYVAVLDTGLRPTHEFFTGKSIAEACFTTKYDPYNPAATMCPNGTGTQYGPGAARHYYNLRGIDLGYDHGTHVTGIATGKNPEGTLKGVAPDANIIAVQVFSDGFIPAICGAENCALSYNSDQIRGLEYVYAQRATYPIASVNMSLGGGKYSAACDTDPRTSAIGLLREAGIATVIAAGNERYCGFVSAPACISNSVAVGASDKTDVVASFSNWSIDMVPLFAPGVAITSSTAASDTSYVAKNGTSMAAPHVAGAWALLHGYAPEASVSQVLSALESTAQHVEFNRCDNPTDISRRIQVDQAADKLGPSSGVPADVLLTNPSTERGAVWSE